MKQKINIFIYSYKNKNLLDSINSLINLSSKNFYLKFFIFDQSNVSKEKDYYSYHNITYRFIKWDDFMGIPYYRNQMLNNECDYYLEINDQITLTENWDQELVNFLKLNSNTVISGKGNLSLTLNDFVIKKEEKHSDNFCLNNWIDTNFLFLQQNNIKFLLSLDIFKYYGQDIFLLTTLMKNNIAIYSCPSNLYSIKKTNNLEDSYSMIDLYYNYNNAIKYLKQNRNQLKAFEINKNINITDFCYLPFDNTGVQYSSVVSDLDQKTNKYFPISTSIVIKENENV